MLRRAGAAAPVLHAAEHRRGRGDKAPEAGEDAGLEVRRVHRRPLGRPDQFYQPRQRANGRVSRREICIRSLAAEPARLEMDQAGIVLPDRREVESPDNPPHRRRDRRAGCRRRRSVPPGETAAFGIVRIERDARLVEIEKRKPRAVSFRRQRRGAAKRIALRRLDLPDGGAEIGEQTGAVARRRRCSRSRQFADATTRPSRSLMAP